MKKTAIVGLLVVALGGVPSPAQGQGWYLGSELGGHVVPALGITGLSNDRASVCDEFINPQYATVTQTAEYEAYNCTGLDRRDDWVTVCRYRARWRAQGHQQAFLFRQAARGRKGGTASGVARRAGTALEHDRTPWADLGVSRATWYRRFRGAKVDGESLGAKGETEANTDRFVSSGTCS